MIRREQVADLQPGDVVELSSMPAAETPTTVRGRLVSYRQDGGQGLTVGPGLILRRTNGELAGFWAEGDWSLTVVSRAPRPLFVNHPRTEPVPGDVVRDDQDPPSADTWAWVQPTASDGHWRHIGGGLRYTASELPARLRLLVDGETGLPPAVQS